MGESLAGWSGSSSVTLSRETPCSVPTNFCIAKQMQTQSAATQLCSRQCCVCQLLLVIASRNGELQRKRDDFQAAGAYSREITLQELSLEAIDPWFGGVRTCYFAQNCVCGGVFSRSQLFHTNCCPHAGQKAQRDGLKLAHHTETSEHWRIRSWNHKPCSSPCS